MGARIALVAGSLIGACVLVASLGEWQRLKREAKKNIQLVTDIQRHPEPRIIKP